MDAGILKIQTAPNRVGLSAEVGANSTSDKHDKISPSQNNFTMTLWVGKEVGYPNLFDCVKIPLLADVTGAVKC